MKKAIATPEAPVPSSPLSQAIVQNGMVFVSGQGPVDPRTGLYAKSDIQAETRRVLDNLTAVLAAAGTTREKVVKVNVYLRDLGEFGAMNEI